MKYFDASSIGYTLPPGNHEITDINLMLNSLIPNKVKVNTTIDDIRKRSNLTTNKTISFTKKNYLCTILGFTQSHSDSSNDSRRRYIQIIPGRCKSNNPINITGTDKIPSKCDCINGSIVSGNLSCAVLQWINQQDIK